MPLYRINRIRRFDDAGLCFGIALIMIAFFITAMGWG